MMHKDQTHIKRNCSSTGIIPSNYKVGVTPLYSYSFAYLILTVSTWLHIWAFDGPSRSLVSNTVPMGLFVRSSSNAWQGNVRSVVFAGRRAMPEFLRYLILNCANTELTPCFFSLSL
jgi:hypothetical protein